MSSSPETSSFPLTDLVGRLGWLAVRLEGVLPFAFDGVTTEEEEVVVEASARGLR